jgi:outer membrane protein assembly factor BamB
MNGNGQSGSIWECGLDGKVRWKIDTGLRAPSDVQLLPGGRLLIADFQGNVVVERDQHGKVVWSRTVESYPTSCQRLANGNTFIATYNQLLEVTPDNKVAFTIRPGGNVYRARKLRNGHILFLNSNAQIVEVETSGKEVRRIGVPTVGAANWGGVELLPNGRYLVCVYSANKVLELDTKGKVLWECTVQTPSSARRLPNGRTLVSSMDAKTVVEFNRLGKPVWKQSTQGRPFFVLRH